MCTLHASLRRARAGLQDENRPLGSFVFLGPTDLSAAMGERPADLPPG